MIKYKTNGKHKDFAELLGWQPQYLAKLVRGENFGLQPVLSLLKALPEINARWLLLGEGSMLIDEFRASDLHKETINHIQAILDLERFIPVMSPDEIQEFEQAVQGHKKPEFTDEARARWIAETAERYQEAEHRFKQATVKSDELCRQQTASE